MGPGNLETPVWLLRLAKKRAVKGIMKNKKRKAHVHDMRGYYGELGYQVRTHGVPLLLKTKTGITNFQKEKAYEMFDILGVR